MRSTPATGSEQNPDLARACAEAIFVGPPAEVLELAGNKVRALEAAKAAGVPTLKSTPPSANIDELVAGAEEIGFPCSSRQLPEAAAAACVESMTRRCFGNR